MCQILEGAGLLDGLARMCCGGVHYRCSPLLFALLRGVGVSGRDSIGTAALGGGWGSPMLVG